MNHFTLTTIAINALALIGVVTATGLAVLQDVPTLPDVLIGAGAGTLVGKLLIYRLERLYGHELPPVASARSSRPGLPSDCSLASWPACWRL